MNTLLTDSIQPSSHCILAVVNVVVVVISVVSLVP